MVKRLLILGIALALLAMSASAGNLVLNGAFTTGDFTDWTNSEWGVGGFPSDPGTLPTDTTFAADTGCVGAPCNDPITGADISQTIGTDTSATYTLSFLYDAGSESGPGTTELDALWDGSIVPGGQIIDATSDTWAEYTFTGLAASTASTVLEFTGRQDPAGLYLTDISVTSETSTTPEPGSLPLIVVGLMGIVAGILRRRTV